MAQEQSKSKRRNWKKICPTEEAVKAFYDKNFPGQTSTQLRESAEGKSFYAHVIRRKLCHILKKGQNDWSDIKTEEDAIRYHNEYFQGKTLKELMTCEGGKSFYQSMHNKGFSGIIKRDNQRNLLEMFPTKEAAIAHYNQNFPGLYFSQIKKKDESFCAYLRRRGWGDVIPKVHPVKIHNKRRDWQVLCPTKEDASEYYKTHLANYTPTQISRKDSGFYKYLGANDWLDVITLRDRRWEAFPTKEDALKYYNEHFAGLTLRQIKKIDAAFLVQIYKRGWKDIIPREKKDWGFIKTKEDASKHYNENFNGLTKHEIETRFPGFYARLQRESWLDVIPGKTIDWSFIKNKEDAAKYYAENFSGQTRKRLHYTEKGRNFYDFLQRNDLLDVLKKERIRFGNFLKTKDDVLKYYNENFAGLTIGQIKKAGKLGATFYQFLNRYKFSDIIPRLTTNWRNIKTKEDAIKYCNENFPGLTYTEISKNHTNLFNFLRKRKWTDILVKKNQLFGKNLRDYSESSPLDSEIGENLFQKENSNGVQVKEVDFGSNLEETIDYVSMDEAAGEDTQVRKLLRLLAEQNNKSNANDLAYSDRPELVQLYNSGVSCAQTSAALLYKVFDILNSNGKTISKVLDIGGAHGFANIKAKSEFEKKTNRDLELTIADMDFSNAHIMIDEADARGNKNIELRQVTLPYDASNLQDKKYDLINATYFFCELNPQEIKETVAQLPESKYFFATLPPSHKEKQDVLVNSLAEKGYKVRYGVFPLKLKDAKGKSCQYKVIAIGGTKTDGVKNG